MLYYIRKYPVSLLIILVVIYLSFFKPPKTEMESIPGIDKVVHVCMYFGMSGMLWLEFMRAHKSTRADVARVVGGLALPCLVQRGGGAASGVLYDLSGWRLVGLCRQYYGSYAGIAHWLVLDEASYLFINIRRCCSTARRSTP